MTTLTTADAWLLLASGWSAAADLRNARAEEAFWTSLAALVEQARADVDANPRPVGQIASVARMRKQIADNECRRLRAELDRWGS